VSEIVTLNDSTWQEHLGSQAALILVSNGEGLRGDFATAFKKAAAENTRLLFARIDPTTSPQAAAALNAGEKPVLIARYQGEDLVRRSRPWGTDVVLAVELLEKTLQAHAPAGSLSPAADRKKDTAMMEKKPAGNKPFVVTDDTFQTEVIDYSRTVPVLVDFWAEWCGPCRMVAPIMEKLAADFAGQVRIAKVDTDANPGLSQVFRIMSIPTIMAFKEGQLVFNQAGAFPEPAFRDLVQQLIALKLPPQEPAPEQ
jgi:thioredoxin